MNSWEALILGIIQGLTEFLPISSSGHLEIGSYILNTNTSENLLFSIVVHIATALSILIVFKKDIKKILSSLFKFSNNDDTQFILKIILSSVPVGLIGIFFEDKVEILFNGNIFLVGIMLIITSCILAITHLQKKDSKKQVSFLSAFIIGIAQSIAILPGISRSGITISTALLLKINKKEATKFSFLMVLIPIFGIMIIKLFKSFNSIETLSTEIELTSLIIGFFSALVSGIIACKWMIKIIQKSNLIYFSIYCFIIGSFSIFTSFNNLESKENKIFTIQPIYSVEELKKIALKSSVPLEDSLEDKSDELVDIYNLDSSIKLDIRYASKNNFMQTEFYTEPRAFLISDAAKMLIKAHQELGNYGYGIVIYDAYRPWFVTKMFWEATPDSLKNFVADPSSGSVHNRGCAVDIGLYNIKNGKIIQMISGYDEFTERAYPSYVGGTKKERENRNLLITIMKKYGFQVYKYEWWHFDFKLCKNKIMNLNFNEIDSIIDLN